MTGHRPLGWTGILVGLLALLAGCGATGSPVSDKEGAGAELASFVCFDLSTSDWQAVADFQALFLPQHRLLDGIEEYRSKTSPPRLGVKLNSGVQVDAWIASLPTEITESRILNKMSVVDSNCAT